MVLTLRSARADRRGPPDLHLFPAISEDDTPRLARSIRERVGSYHHPVGTCAIGPDPDRGGVVDASGAVHGIAGLWVADASVMPTIPAANTNLSTIMVAERIAGWLAVALYA